MVEENYVFKDMFNEMLMYDEMIYLDMSDENVCVVFVVCGVEFKKLFVFKVDVLSIRVKFASKTKKFRFM